MTPIQQSKAAAAFVAQKDQPGGYKTMRSYLWKLEGDTYDAQHNG